ncbi:hypothetical protein J3A83DRAFT_4190674 [Scleroderma citrinum]
MKPTGSGELPHKDNTISLGDLFTVSLDDTQTEAAPTLTFLSQHSYDVTIGDMVKVIGCEVWVITGDKKGCQAHLVSLGHQSSIISMLGYPDFQVKNIDIMTRCFIPDAIELRQPTPPSQPPSPAAEQSESGETNDPWTISPLDLMRVVPFDPPIMPPTATPTVDKDFHVCLNVGLGYDCGSLCNTKIEHHTIPAVHLTAAPPRAKGQTCMVLKGELAGQIWCVKECRLKKQQVVLSNGVVLSLNDVCLVIEAHA